MLLLYQQKAGSTGRKEGHPMEKMVTKMPISYRYVAERKGAHYTLNGKKFMNHGDLMEVACKAAHGLEAKKDGNTPFDKASDIPEYNASVKSAGCSLFNKKLGKNFEVSAKVYFDRDVSTSFWFAQDVGEDLWIYKMNEAEFRTFVKMFCYWDKSSEKIKSLGFSKKMMTWLESLC